MEDFSAIELHKAALAELVGTFFLALAALISGSPFAVGLTLAFFVYAIGDISGCHINPAVTIGLMTIRRVSPVRGVYYVLAQVAGAFLARLVAPQIGHLPATFASGNMFAEFFGVAFLLLAVMATSDASVPKAASGITIGAGLTAGLITSGGILNPAVAVAMGQVMSPAIWTTLLSGIVFALLSRLYVPRKVVQLAGSQANRDGIAESQSIGIN